MRVRLGFCIALPLLAGSVLGQRVAEGPEPNAGLASATSLACGAEAQGALSSASDEDWYRVVLQAGADLTIATAPGPGGAARDTVLTLLDDTGGPLQASDDGVGAGWYSELFAPGLAAGTYYVAVEGGPNAVAGSYLLDVRCRALAAAQSPPLAPEGPENNDPRTGGVATSVLAPSRCSGALQSTGRDGDWDFWRVLLFGDSVLHVRLDATATAAAPAEDPVLYVFDAATPPNLIAGPFFASDRDAWDQRLDVRVPGGLVQVAVRGVAGSQPGAYLLDLARSPAAAAVVFSGGCAGRTLEVATTAFGPGAPLVRETPQLGATYSLDGSSLGANGYCFHVVGVASTFVDLTPFGAVGCALEVNYVDTVFRFADAAGAASWTVPVPDTVALAGAQLHSQVAVLDLSNPLGVTTSNRVTATIGS